MGGCSSDIYKTVKKEYGEDFQQFIVSAQSLKSFKDFIRNKQQQYDAKNKSKRQSLHREVYQRQQTVCNNFNQVKMSLDVELPFGVESFQQMKKSSLQNMLGFENYKRKFNQFHANIDRELNQQSESFHRQTEQFLKKIEQQSNVNNEKIKLFHEMPENKKKYIYDKGAKQFQQLIKKKEKQLQTASLDQLNPDTHLEKLNNILSLQSLDSLVNESRNHFRTETFNIIGNNMDSNIRV